MVKKISIIVVNWNCGALTRVAVAPYINYQNETISCEVIVVDNASTDNSIAILQQMPIKLISNTVNTGFGHACNQAFEQSEADYILLLNPDTVSTAATLTGLVDFLEKNPTYAVTGPQQKTEHNEVIRSCGRFPIFKTALYEVLSLSKLFPRHFTPAPIMLDWDHLESRTVDHIMGSYMLIRKQPLNKTGFMDKDYFVYWEDIDLSKRIALAGYQSYYNTDFTILHEGGASGEKAVSLRLFYSISARRIYWKKHFNSLQCFILTFFSLTTEPFLRLLGIFLKEKKLPIKSVADSYTRYIKKIARG